MVENTQPAKSEPPRGDGRDDCLPQGPVPHKETDIGDPPNATSDPEDEPPQGGG